MNTHNNIERYIQNDLEHEELILFENALVNDASLKAEYKLRKDIDNAIKEQDITLLRDQLDEIADISPYRSKSGLLSFIKNSKRWVAAAAITLLLAFGGSAYLITNQPVSNEMVFNEFYKPYKVTVSYRSADSELNNILTSAFEAYKDQNFTHALTLFQKVLNKREDIAVRMYSGVSYIEIEEYKKANKSFKKILDGEDNLFIDQAKWYLAMCYIKVGNLDKAKYWLKNLKSTSDHYEEKAEQVLSEFR